MNLSYITRNLLSVAVMALAGECVALAQQTDTTYISLTDGTVQAFPNALIKERTQGNTRLTFTDVDGGKHVFHLADIVSEGTQNPVDNPWLTVFKFNNKYNTCIFQDVELDPASGTRLEASVASIGKWLTASFQCSSDDAKVYVDGVQQQSKRSRQHFTKDIVYTVAMPGRTVLRRYVDDDGSTPSQDDGDETVEVIPLTATDISTNAPSNYPDTEGLEMVLDDNFSTFFHSTWGNDGPNEKLPLEEAPWIEAKLPDAVHHLKVYYCTRMDTNSRSPEAWDIQVSNDGTTWTTVKQLSKDADDLPQQGEYTSPTIDLGGDYQNVRLVMTAANYKNYLCLSELRLYKVTPSTGGDTTPTVSGRCEMVPMGLDYTVHLDFLTDQATDVPRIDLDLVDANVIRSKTTYIDATITIDGAGVFPSMEATPVKVKGRGNSSWDGSVYEYGDWYYSPKNPYRVKFESKVKPFGLTKGKNWVLLANKINGSMTTNAVGMKAAGIVGTVAYNHIVPVELYINGEYRGNYNFTEKLGFHNNSIDLEDQTQAVLIELDTYSPDYDETLFTTSRYALPAKVKYPNFIDDDTELTIDDITGSFNTMLDIVSQRGDLSEVVDIDALAKFYMVNELILNLELMHPKSTYIFHPNLNDPESRWTWGPVWDLDWAFGHELSQSTYYSVGQQSNFLTAKSMEKNAFWQALRKCGESLDRAIYYAWYSFMEEGGLDELLDFCDEYYAYARPSLEHNADWWGDGMNYATVTANSRKWLEQRARYLYAKVTPYDIGTDVDALPNIEEQKSFDFSSNSKDPSTFDVYDVRGLRVRHGVTGANWRNGLQPGLYIVRGRKVLVD